MTHHFYVIGFAPVGDINVLVGSEKFKLLCSINTEHHLYTQQGLRSNSLFIEQRREVKPTKPVLKSTTHLTDVSQNNFETTILQTRVLNETTIEAIYDPRTATSDLLACSISTGRAENVSSICTKMINVGCKYGSCIK